MDAIKRVFKIKMLSDSVYFKMVFLLWTLVHSLTLGQYITGYLSPIMIIWGGLLVIKIVIIDKIDLSNKYFILICAFLASYVVTILINRNINFTANTKTLIWGVIMMIALFINDYNADKDKVFKDICRIARVVIIGSLIISFISLLMFFLNVEFWIPRTGGRLIPQGYYAARLWGIYVDPNQSCNIAIVSIMLSLVVYIKNILMNRKLLIFNILIQYFLLVLANSRGGEIGFLFVTIGLFYVVIEYFVRNKIKGINLRVIVSVVLSIILSVALLSTFRITRKTLSIIPSLGYNIQMNRENTDSTSKKPTPITIDRADVNGDDPSNGRIELWTDGLKLSKHAPIFGFGDRNIMVMADKIMPGSSISKQYVHNGFLHMFISGGAVGTVIMLTIIGIVAITAMKKIMRKQKYNEEYYIYTIISLMVGSMLLTTVFLTEIFYQNSFTATIFWIFMGYLVYFNKNEDFSCR